MSGEHLSIARPVLLGLGAVLLLLLGFGSWSVGAELSGAVVADGRVSVAEDRKVVQHPDGGVVAEVAVKEGALVRAGDILLRLDGAAIRSELQIVEGQLDELVARTARLEAERDGRTRPDFPPDLQLRAAAIADVAEQIDGQARLFAARQATLAQERALLAQRIGQIRAQLEGIAAQATAVRTQLQLIREQLMVQEELLDRGLAPAATVLALRREVAVLEGRLGELVATRARTEAQVTETEIEIAGLATRQREAAAAELRDIGPFMLELAERRRALAERVARLEVRAPVSGIVMGLQVTTPRSVLRPADAILHLVPQDQPLVITARISPVSVGAATVGQAGEVVFRAFATEAVPPLRARVTRLSPDALTDPQTGQSYFSAELQLLPGELFRLGDRTLLPGMTAEIFLHTESRSPLAYLVSPLTDVLRRALRES